MFEMGFPQMRKWRFTFEMGFPQMRKQRFMFEMGFPQMRKQRFMFKMAFPQARRRFPPTRKCRSAAKHSVAVCGMSWKILGGSKLSLSLSLSLSLCKYHTDFFKMGKNIK